MTVHSVRRVSVVIRRALAVRDGPGVCARCSPQQTRGPGALFTGPSAGSEQPRRCPGEGWGTCSAPSPAHAPFHPVAISLPQSGPGGSEMKLPRVRSHLNPESPGLQVEEDGLGVLAEGDRLPSQGPAGQDIQLFGAAAPTPTLTLTLPPHTQGPHWIT